MIQQIIQWTILPNGASGGKLSLSVLVSPWLQAAPDGTLALFQDFLDWPATVGNIQFDLMYALPQGQGSPHSLATGLRPLRLNDLSSTDWKALFVVSLPVERFDAAAAPTQPPFEDHSTRPLRSYPVKQLHDNAIVSPYSALAANPYPSPATGLHLTAVNGPFGGLAISSKDTRNAIQNYQNSILARDKTVPSDPSQYAASFASGVTGVAALSDAQWHLMQADAFHRADLDPKGPHPAAPRLGFAQVVAAVGQYPWLMRRLGLILDLEVAMPGPQIDLFGADIWVVPHWTSKLREPGTTYDYKRRTRIGAGGSASFQAAHRPPNVEQRTGPGQAAEFQGGILQLGNEDLFHTTQLETGSAALRVLEFATQQAQVELSPNPESREQPGPPPPPPPDRPTDESGSPMVGAPFLRSDGIHVSRNGLAQSLLGHFQNAANNRAETSPLYAEELERGYRVDVREQLPSGGWGDWRSLCRRQGVFTFAAQPKNPLTVPEDEGWVSIGAAQPTNPASANVVKGVNGEIELRVHETIFRWGGWSLSVPRQGNTLRPKGTDFIRGNDKSPYQDLLRADFSVPRGSLPKLRFGRTYELRARIVDLAGNGPPYGYSGDQGNPNALTGKIAYLRFDPVNAPHVVLRQDLLQSPGEGVDRVVIRTHFNSRGISLDSPAPSERHIAPPRAAALMAEWHGVFDNPVTGAINPTTSYNLIAAKDALAYQETQSLDGTHAEAQMVLPYLPDPIAAGAVLWGLPGRTEPAQRISFAPAGSAWPNRPSFRLRAIGGNAPPQWDQAQRVLTVSLPPGETASIDLSSYLAERDLESMGIWQWILDRKVPNLQELRTLALEGRHWMLTPPRRLTLVHAVQQPLIAPSLYSLTVQRDPRSTSASILDSRPTPIHGNSTSQVDVEGRWTEIMAGADPTLTLHGPFPTQSARAHAFTIELERGGSQPAANGTAGPDPNIPTEIVVSGQHEFGDTKRRCVTYMATATTRFREYFLPAASGDCQVPAGMFTRSSGVVQVDIPSSAPPLAPEVLHVVPTFGWSAQRLPNGVASIRSGNGLRIYMKRGWYSSGEGEMLGVVLPQRPPEDLPGAPQYAFQGLPESKLKSLVTQWGKDPVWDVVPGAGPSWDDVERTFSSAVELREQLSLREVDTDPTLDPANGGSAVAVAAHEVWLDSESDLLYCDIVMGVGAYYMPFVRLALVRYQPNSVAGMHLSHVVLADFAQLTPDRALCIVMARGGKSATVTVCGIAQSMDPKDLMQKARVEVYLEARIEGMPDDELAWRPFQPTTVLLAPVQRGGAIFWTGALPLPDPLNRPPGLRLAVREYELYGASYADNNTMERLVYADAVPLPRGN